MKSGDGDQATRRGALLRRSPELIGGGPDARASVAGRRTSGDKTKFGCRPSLSLYICAPIAEAIKCSPAVSRPASIDRSR